ALDLVGLDLAGTGEDRALRVDADDLAAGHLALEHPRDAGDRAAGAGRADERVDAPARLLEDLAAGPLLVGAGVVRVAVLVEGVRVRQHFLQALRHADVALRRVERRLGRGADDFGPERLEDDLLLAAPLRG